MRLLRLLLCLTMVIGLLPGGLPEAKAETTVVDMTDLKTKLKENGGTIKLGNDIQITDGTLEVKNDTVLDLAGKTLQLGSSGDGIVVSSGTLRITDSSGQSGKITGQNTGVIIGSEQTSGQTVTLEKGTITGFEKGVVLEGNATFNMTGGTITNCNNTGVVLEDNTTFNMIGGTIANCNCGVDQKAGTINISGSPIVEKKDEKDATGIFIPVGNVINITGALTDGANIGVTMGNNTGIFTKDFGKYNPGVEPSTFFKSDNGSGKVFLNNGEGKINAGYVISVSIKPDDEKGSVTGTGTLEKGTTANLTATLKTGYAFANWTENGSPVSTANPYTFTVNSDRELIANFNKKTYTITVGTYPFGTNSQIVNPGQRTYEYGDIAILEAKSQQSGNKWLFNRWTEGPKNDGETLSTNLIYTFTVEENREVTAQFEMNSFTMTVSIDPPAGGEVLGCPNVKVPYGTNISLSEKPATGYRFIKWEGDAEINERTDESITVVPTQDMTVTAHFEKLTYTIKVQKSPSEGGTVENLRPYYPYGETADLTARPANGYGFVWWKEGNSQISRNSYLTFTVEGERNLSAVFARMITRTVTFQVVNGQWEAGGTADQYAVFHFPDDEDYAPVLAADQIPQPGTPAEHYAAGAWDAPEPNTETHISNNRTYTYRFVPMNYTITATANPDGSGTVSGGGTYEYNTTATLQATAEGGYSFVNWSENGTMVTSNNPYTFTVLSDRTLKANYTPNTYTISAHALPSEGGVVAGAGIYTYTQTAELVAVPAEAYHFVNWTENGTQVSASRTYTFQVTGARALTANFSERGIVRHTVTFRVANGSWNDEITEDRSVVLWRYADEDKALVLTEADIPEAGDHPEKGYVKGGWDVTPGSETAITEDKTYTYSYIKEPQENGKIVQGPLTDVPPELRGIYTTLEKLQQAMMMKMTINGQPVLANQTKFYDVVLYVSFDGGRTWVLATADNFPAEGISVLLAYPEGTNKEEYDFSVSHMFTITSARLGTTAGNIETPTVTETEDGLNVVLHGLSPVAVSWAKTNLPTPAPTATPTAAPTATPTPKPVPKTGDTAELALWLGLVVLGLIGIGVVIGIRRKNRNKR